MSFSYIEHFSFELTDCNAHSDASPPHKVRLSNHYTNQTRLKVCLETRQSGSSLCLNEILVSMQPEMSQTGSVHQVVSPIQIFNVRPPKFLDGGLFNFEYWIR